MSDDAMQRQRCACGTRARPRLGRKSGLVVLSCPVCGLSTGPRYPEAVEAAWIAAIEAALRPPQRWSTS